MISKISLSGVLLFFFFASAVAVAQKPKADSQPKLRTITVISEPNAIVWLNGVRYGKTDTEGKLSVGAIPAGSHNLRVRAFGFREVSKALLPTAKGEFKITLVKTTDPAELAFQEAENIANKSKAETLYQKAIGLRPKYAEAFVGLARVFTDENNFEDAHLAIESARKIRPIYPEASAVEGRIFRSEFNDEKAAESFKRAIREGKGVQPEAFTGLALLLKDKAEYAGNSGDFQAEADLYKESAKYFESAVRQLYGSPDAIIIYQFYGLIYEKIGNKKEAIRVYEDFLKTFPDISESSSVRSFIVQLRKQIEQEQR